MTYHVAPNGDIEKWREMAELTEISRFDAGTNFKLDRLWSEFEDASVEHEFQRYQRVFELRP